MESLNFLGVAYVTSQVEDGGCLFLVISVIIGIGFEVLLLVLEYVTLMWLRCDGEREC